MTTLKPCPFCGGEPTKERIEPHAHHFLFMPDYPGAWIINCDTCEFRLFSHESITDVEAKWNQRHPARAPAHDKTSTKPQSEHLKRAINLSIEAQRLADHIRAQEVGAKYQPERIDDVNIGWFTPIKPPQDGGSDHD